MTQYKNLYHLTPGEALAQIDLIEKSYHEKLADMLGITTKQVGDLAVVAKTDGMDIGDCARFFFKKQRTAKKVGQP